MGVGTDLWCYLDRPPPLGAEAAKGVTPQHAMQLLYTAAREEGQTPDQVPKPSELCSRRTHYYLMLPPRGYHCWIVCADTESFSMQRQASKGNELNSLMAMVQVDSHDAGVLRQLLFSYIKSRHVVAQGQITASGPAVKAKSASKRKSMIEKTPQKVVLGSHQ